MNGLAWSKVRFRWLAMTLAVLAAFALVSCNAAAARAWYTSRKRKEQAA